MIEHDDPRDRGADAVEDRAPHVVVAAPLATTSQLKREPRLEMHTRGG